MRALSIVFSLLLFAGCSHSHTLISNNSDEIDSLVKSANKKTAVLFHKEGHSYKGKNLAIEENCVSIDLSESNRTKTLHLSEIERIQYINHPQGFLEGLGLGTLIGGATGFLAGAIVGYSDTSQIVDTRVIGAAFLAVVGGLSGGLVGLGLGSKTNHEIVASMADRNTDCAEK